MLRKKFELMALLVTGLVILASCGARSQNDKSNSQKTSTTIVKKNSKSSASSSSDKKKEMTPWNATKDQQLTSFINQWAPTMGQKYTKYDGKNPLETSTGVSYPDALSKETMNGATISIGWSHDGTGSYDYNVVAIYNYDQTEPPLPGRITYLFAFHNGQPIALVDTSRDGDPSVVETQNTSVKTNFAKIANVKSTSSVSSNSVAANSSAISFSDPRVIGVVLHQIVQPDDDLTKESNFGVYKVDDHYVTNNGTSAGSIPFQVDGNTVSYWVRDPNSQLTDAETDLDHGMIKKTISVSALKQQGYSTSTQQKGVQAIAARLTRPE